MLKIHRLSDGPGTQKNEDLTYDTYHNRQSYREFDFHGYATTLSYEKYMNSIQTPNLIGFTSLIKY